jgi:hypothetical protein
MAGGEPGQARDQPQGGKARRGGDGDLPARLRGSHAGSGVAKARQAVDDRTLHHLAGLGEHQGAVAPLEQGRAERFFDLLDLAADRRLGEKQLAGGHRETQRARGRLEGVEQMQRRQLRASDAARHRAGRK